MSSSTRRSRAGTSLRHNFQQQQHMLQMEGVEMDVPTPPAEIPDIVQTMPRPTLKVIVDLVNKLSRFVNRNHRELGSQFDNPVLIPPERKTELGKSIGFETVKDLLRADAYPRPELVYRDVAHIFKIIQTLNVKTSLPSKDAEKLKSVLDEMWTEEAKAGFLPHVEETIEFLAHEPYPPYPATPTTSPTPPVDSQYVMEATPAPSPGPGPGPGLQPYGAVPSASTSPAAKRRKVDSISESRYDELGNLILPSPDVVVPVKESKRERERREKREARERIARNGSYGDEDDEGSGEMGAGSRAPAKQKEEKKEADTETGWMKDQQTKVGNLATVSRPVNPSDFWLNLVRSYFRAHMKDATTLYQEILNQIMSHRDEKSGRLSGAILMRLPAIQDRPDFYLAVHNPLSFEIILSRVNSGHYPSAADFDRDLNKLFCDAKCLVRFPMVEYGDILALQRLYHELTKDDGLNTLPNEADKAARLASVTSGPGNVKGPDESAAAKLTSKDKIFLDGVNFKGEIIKAGDWIHLVNPDNPAKPIIAQVFKTFKKIDSPQRMLSVCWYYRPEETVHPVQRTFYENEVFKTGNFMVHVLEDYLEKCLVMFYTKYLKGRPKGFNASMPLYVCEHRYKEDVKSFKKIKNWTSCIPEEIRQQDKSQILEDLPQPFQIAKVKSPFVRGIQGPGMIGEPAEEEEEEQKKYLAPLDDPTVSRTIARKPTRPSAASRSNSRVISQVAPSPAHAAYAANSGSPSTHALGSSAYRQSIPTPAQIAAYHESFEPLPDSIKNTFRSDPGTGETLWFPTPPVVVPEPEQPSHSFEYLSYLAKQRTLEADQEQIPPLDQDELDAMGQAIEDALKNSQDSDISEVLTPIDFNFELASFGQPGKAGIDPDQFIQALDGLTDSLHAETAEYLVSTSP